MLFIPIWVGISRQIIVQTVQKNVLKCNESPWPCWFSSQALHYLFKYGQFLIRGEKANSDNFFTFGDSLLTISWVTTSRGFELSLYISLHISLLLSESFFYSYNDSRSRELSVISPMKFWNPSHRPYFWENNFSKVAFGALA